MASKLLDEMSSSLTTLKYIEYDALEEISYQKIKKEKSSNPKDDDLEFSDTACRLEAWNQARNMALHKLESYLRSSDDEQQDEHQTILLDDNFHLRGMRKQIHRLLLRLGGSNDLRFGILWMDQPLEVCLRRNQQRAKQIPEETIRKLHATMEAPRISWEQYWMKINNDSTFSEIIEFIRNCDAIVPIEDGEVDPELLEQEQEKTRQSRRHNIDQTLRSWVGRVARIDKSLARKANLARKEIIQRSKQQGEESVESLSETFLDFVLDGNADAELRQKLHASLLNE